MPLERLDHFLIQTADMEKTRDWYVRVLGLRVGPNPDFKFPVCWLYIGERDVLHITEGGSAVSANRKAYLGQQSEALSGSGVIDHVAFRVSGLREMLAHLEREGVPYQTRQVDDQGLFQIFLVDPNDVKVELSFANSEARGIEASVMASKLPADA